MGAGDGKNGRAGRHRRHAYWSPSLRGHSLRGHRPRIHAAPPLRPVSPHTSSCAVRTLRSVCVAGTAPRCVRHTGLQSADRSRGSRGVRRCPPPRSRDGGSSGWSCAVGAEGPVRSGRREKMSFLSGLFGPICEIEVVLNDAETRKLSEIKTEEGKIEKHFLFYDGESVAGKVNIVFRQPGKRLEHQGIRIEFVGQIELFNDKSNTHEFVNLVKELALPGELTQSRSYDFEFMQVEKPYESYIGSNVRLRYFLKVTIVRRLSDLIKEYDLIVHQLATYPDVNNSIKMEVGIEDCLHIEFEYNKSKYHLKDVIVGKIYFLLVRIKIQHMELQLIKKEITGIGPSTTTETETVAKYEIMDGAPVKGESIPIRLFLAGYDPTPTMRDVNKKFSVRYFLNLVLVDEEDRRYFKQQEIILWRKAPEKIRKRTNFHQRYEGPDPQASAEEPEI